MPRSLRLPPLARDRLRLPLLLDDRPRAVVAPFLDFAWDPCPPELERCRDEFVAVDAADLDAEPPERWLFVFAMTCYSVLENWTAAHAGMSRAPIRTTAATAMIRRPTLP